MVNDEKSKSLVAAINGLTDMLERDTLGTAESAKLSEMKLELMEKAVMRKHHRALFEMGGKQKLWKTHNPDMTSKTRIGLIKKLYSHYFGDENASITDLFPLWLKEKENGIGQVRISSLTADRTRNEWKQLIEGNPVVLKPIAKVTAQELYQYFLDTVGDGLITHHRLDDIKSILNGVYDYAVRNGIVPHNVSRELRVGRLPTKIEYTGNQSYTDEERLLILNDLKDSEDMYDLSIEASFCLCCRVSEVRALGWDKVDFDNMKISISSQIVTRRINGKNTEIMVPYTKSRKQQGIRDLPISPRLQQILKKAWQLNPHGEYIFMSNGSFLHTNTVNRHLKYVTRRLKIKYMSSHKIRFWCVTSQFAHGADILTIQANAGHADKDTTLHYGTHAAVATVNDKTWNEVCN